MGTTFREVRYAIRLFAARPLFTSLTALILGLGIGASTALFTVVDAWLLQPLPFRNPDSLAAIWRIDRNRPGVPSVFPTRRDYQSWKEQARSFQSLSAYFWRSLVLRGSGPPEVLMAEIVTPNFFETLGVEARLGRAFAASDVGSPVVVLSHELWERRFGSSPDVLGKSITLDRGAYTIAGIMPPGFLLPSIGQTRRPDIWILLQPGDESFWGYPFSATAIIARLKPGVQPTAARSELAALRSGIESSYPPGIKATGLSVARLQDDVTRTLRPVLLMLTGAVGVLLLIATSNVAGLLTGRALERQKEIAVRAALGCGLRGMLRQLLTESVVLALIGSVLGVALAAAGLKLFLGLAPFETPPVRPITLNLRALAFAVSAAALTGVVFGLLPAWHALRADVVEALKSSSRGSSSGRGMLRSRGILVGAEVALSLVLLSGAGLLLKSFALLESEPLGFRPGGVLVANLALSSQAYREHLHRAEFAERLLSEVRALPGVSAAGLTSHLPLQNTANRPVAVEGRPSNDAGMAAARQVVTPEYFGAIGIPLIEGRYLNQHDREDSLPVVMINQSAAQRFMRGEGAIGKRIQIGTGTSASRWLTIVGVVGDTKYTQYDSLDWTVRPELFIPYRQAQGEAFDVMAVSVIVVLRAAGDPAQLAGPLRQRVNAVDPDLPLTELKTMEANVARAVSQPRIRVTLLAVLAAAALILASAGLYGVVSQSVEERRTEIAIRMALGASPASILRGLVGGVLLVTAIGTAFGIGAAWALGRFMRAFLYQMSPADPPVLALGAAILVVAALAASFVPIRRATKANPMMLLRSE
ncbi:MAG: ABC transporter permease [Bryobacteraceae bacterium]